MTAGEILKVDLVSGASNKARRFNQAIKTFSDEQFAQLGVVGITLGRTDCPVKVYEKNHWKSAPLLYTDKAAQTHQAIKDQLSDGKRRIVNDVHPKAGIPGKSLPVVLTKYPHPQEIVSRADREDVLVEALYEQFRMLPADMELLKRVGSGVVPLALSGLVGLLDAKLYTIYSKNIYRDKGKVRALFQWSAEHHTSIREDGTTYPSNDQLGRSVYIAGGMPEEDAVDFAVRELKMPVEVCGRSSDPIEEIEAMGDGFTGELVLASLQMMQGVEISATKQPSTRVSRNRVNLLPNQRTLITGWSNWDHKYITKPLGPYSL